MYTKMGFMYVWISVFGVTLVSAWCKYVLVWGFAFALCRVCRCCVLCKGVECLFDCVYMFVRVLSPYIYIMFACASGICVYIVYVCGCLACVTLLLCISVCLSMFIQLCSYKSVSSELGSTSESIYIRTWDATLHSSPSYASLWQVLWGESSLFPLMFYWMYNQIFGPCIVISFEPKANVTVYGAHIYYNYRIIQL